MTIDLRRSLCLGVLTQCNKCHQRYLAKTSDQEKKCISCGGQDVFFVKATADKKKETMITMSKKDYDDLIRATNYHVWYLADNSSGHVSVEADYNIIGEFINGERNIIIFGEDNGD